MDRDRTRTPRSKNIRNRGVTGQGNGDQVKELMNRKVKSPLLKEILAHADISSILKEPGYALQEDVEEDSFNPPLHSTAVYADDDELLQTNENPRIPAKLVSSGLPVIQEKSKKSKIQPGANTDHSAPRSDIAKPMRTSQKKAQVPDLLSSKKHGTSRNLPQGAPPSSQAPKITPNKRKSPQKKAHVPEPGPSKKHGPSRNLSDVASPFSQALQTTSYRNVVSAEKSKTRKKNQNKKKPRKDTMETTPGGILSPENVPKSVRRVSELDVVLSECGKVIELYREEVEKDVCKKALDVFCHSFKEELSTTISDLQKLNDLKRKNAKIKTEIGRKRRRLLEVRHEVITKLPKFKGLQKEYSELKKKQESLKSGRAFLDNLAHLKDNYMKLKTKKPHIKETYGMSSLPALCLEAENIMKAEQHFHIVNRQLQSFIDLEKRDG